MQTTRNIAARARELVTPALFAIQASQGRWKPARHLLQIDQAVIDTIRGESPPLLVIEAPPRHGKSELISKCLPAWYLGVYPEKRVMLATYEAHFARSWGRKARNLFEEVSESFFGLSLDSEVASAADWGLAGCEGGMVTAGVGGPLTGRGADLLIIDDPVKNAEEATSEIIRENVWDWWQSTASTRIEPSGCAIIIATRWHEDDLSGRLIRASETGEGAPIRRICLPAIAEEHDDLGRVPGEALWPERWPLKSLEQRRQGHDEYWWRALYQQRPSRGARAVWPESYFGEHLWARNWPESFEIAVIAIDPARGSGTGDDTAIVFAGLAGNAIWVDAHLARDPIEIMARTLVDFVACQRVNRVAVESNFALDSSLQNEVYRASAEKKLAPFMMEGIINSSNKELRISRLGSFLMRRQLRFRNSPSCRKLVHQLREFPGSKHDDGPDALELAIRELHQLRNINLETSSVAFERALCAP
jgi:predicted phage terminase large subunit-like protein